MCRCSTNVSVESIASSSLRYRSNVEPSFSELEGFLNSIERVKRIAWTIWLSEKKFLSGTSLFFYFLIASSIISRAPGFRHLSVRVFFFSLSNDKIMETMKKKEGNGGKGPVIFLAASVNRVWMWENDEATSWPWHDIGLRWRPDGTAKRKKDHY